MRLVIDEKLHGEFKAVCGIRRRQMKEMLEEILREFIDNQPQAIKDLLNEENIKKNG